MAVLKLIQWKFNVIIHKKKVKWSCYRPGVTQRVGRGIVLLFHDRSTRMRWVVSSTPRPHFTPGKDTVPILQETGWAKYTISSAIVIVTYVIQYNIYIKKNLKWNWFHYMTVLKLIQWNFNVIIHRILNYRLSYYGMWCGYRKLGDCFYLAMFVDSSLIQWL